MDFTALAQVIDIGKLCSMTPLSDVEVAGLKEYLSTARAATVRQYGLLAASLCPPPLAGETPRQYIKRLVTALDELSSLPEADAILREDAQRRAEGLRQAAGLR
jgi:hypothetical protein